MTDADEIPERDMILGWPMYYDREGSPISHKRYRELMLPAYESEEARARVKRVAGELVDDPEGREHFVSTVWLGMDHAFAGPPLIFETMIFCHEHECEWSHWMDRYTSEVEAMAGHAFAAEAVRVGQNVGSDAEPS